MSEITAPHIDMKNAAEKLSKLIQSAFVELLTAEQWQEMVRVEIHRFCQPGERREYNQRVETPSVLSEVVRAEFEKVVREETKKILSGSEFESGLITNGNGYRAIISPFIKEWLTEHRTEIIEATLQIFLGQTAQQLLNHLRSNNR